jgi:tetratricopeptide (TPR) repeat protein
MGEHPTMSLPAARLLIRRERYADAEETLRQYLVQHPDDAVAHSMLAITLAALKRLDEALQEANTSVRLNPNDPYAYQAQAIVYRSRFRLKKARSAIQESIRLAPQNAQFFAVLARLHLDSKQWHEALRATDTALYLAPENVEVRNLRAEALVKLGRKQEAAALLDGALAKDPNNPNSHAHLGWTMLQQGEINRAIEYYREALRLNPDKTWAQAGIIESLKARNPIYRHMLAFYLRIRALGLRKHLAIAIGGLIGFRILKNIGESSPTLAPFAYAIIGLYCGFIFLTWTAPILFDLYLRVHRVGRLALPQERKAASNWVAVCLLVAAGFLLTAVPAESDQRVPLLWNALKSAAMMLPIAGSFNVKDDVGIRRGCFGYTVALAIVGVVGLFFALEQGEIGNWDILFAAGIAACSWVAAAMIGRADR